jgi:hypothetical protein
MQYSAANDKEKTMRVPLNSGTGVAEVDVVVEDVSATVTLKLTWLPDD